MVLTMQVVEWRCVALVAGEQCVMKDGAHTMPTQHVDSWDSKQIKQFLSEEGVSVMLIILVGQFIYHKMSVEEMMTS
jgi:hypothetical protein